MLEVSLSTLKLKKKRFKFEFDKLFRVKYEDGRVELYEFTWDYENELIWANLYYDGLEYSCIGDHAFSKNQAKYWTLLDSGSTTKGVFLGYLNKCAHLAWKL